MPLRLPQEQEQEQEEHFQYVRVEPTFGSSPAIPLLREPTQLAASIDFPFRTYGLFFNASFPVDRQEGRCQKFSAASPLPTHKMLLPALTANYATRNRMGLSGTVQCTENTSINIDSNMLAAVSDL